MSWTAAIALVAEASLVLLACVAAAVRAWPFDGVQTYRWPLRLARGARSAGVRKLQWPFHLQRRSEAGTRRSFRVLDRTLYAVVIGVVPVQKRLWRRRLVATHIGERRVLDPIAEAMLAAALFVSEPTPR
jgi:hypothetical protein